MDKTMFIQTVKDFIKAGCTNIDLMERAVKDYENCTGGVLYMKKADYHMYINEQPDGGFEWSVKDFEPKNNGEYIKLLVFKDES